MLSECFGGNNTELYDVPPDELRKLCVSLFEFESGEDSTPSDCEHKLLCAEVKKWLFQYALPIFTALSSTGNTLNVAVYCSRFLRSSTAIHLLIMKAVANFFFVLFLLPNTLVQYYQNHPRIVGALVFTDWISNFFGTCATWYTVLILGERFLQVCFPVHSQAWCNTRTMYKAIGTATLLSALLNACRFITLEVKREEGVNFCDMSEQLSENAYRAHVRDTPWAQHLNRFYFIAHPICVVILPVVILLILCARITYQLMYKRRSVANNSSQKRCVSRLSFVTTVCHLLFETPIVVTSIQAAIEGSEKIDPRYCTATALVNYLNVFNASLPFFVYFCCISRFRYLLLQMLGCRINRGRASSITSNDVRTTVVRPSIVELRRYSYGAYGAITITPKPKPRLSREVYLHSVLRSERSSVI